MNKNRLICIHTYNTGHIQSIKSITFWFITFNLRHYIIPEINIHVTDEQYG